MSHRRSRYRIAACVVAWLLAAPLAPAQSSPSPGVPAEVEAVAATANAPGAADTSDRLTELARQMAATETPADAQATASERESRPLGTASASGNQLASAPQQDNSAGSGTLGTLGALGFVLAVILVARWAWIRFGGGVISRSTPAVEVLSRTSVAPRNHVLLLRVGGRILVVGDSAGGLRTLTQIDEPDEVASLLEAVTAAKTTSVSQGFAQLLSNKGGEFGIDGDDPEHRVDRARDSLSGLLSRVRTLSQAKGDGN